MNVLSSIAKGYKLVAGGAKHGKAVAKRAANIQGVGKLKTTVAKSKGAVSGALSPVIARVAKTSDTFETVTKTSKIIGRNIQKTKSRRTEERKFKSTITGIKASAPDIKNAIKDIVGINDVKAAKEAGGSAKSVLEAGKAAVRLISTLGLFVAGNIVPVPGASVAGWVAGEKLANTCLGKPFTKQAKNLLQKK